MSHRVADVVRAAAVHISPLLVDAGALGRILELSAPLPAAFNWAGFECRLRAGDDRVDFGVCIDSRDRGRRTIDAALAAGAALPGLEFARPLLGAWVDHETLLHRACPVIWVEWDLPARSLPAAFAFVCVDPEFPGGRARPPLPRADLRSLASTTVELLTGTPLAPSTQGLLDLCARTVPPPARLLHIAPLPRDRGGGLRIHTSLPPNQVIPWLQTLGWCGDIDAATRAVALCRRAGRVGVQLTLGDRLMPYLGLEYYSLADPRSEAEWPAVMARLVAAGIVDPDKAAAVLRWFGDETVDLAGAAWFVNIQRQFYVKLVVSGPEIEAKTYLTLHPRYIPW